MKKMTIRDVTVAGKRVLVRVDFNVPIDEKTGTILDDNRIRGALPTVKYLIDKGARIILMSHLGRPKGADPKLTLKPEAQRLSELLGKKVTMASECVGTGVEGMVSRMKSGDVMMLENLRFHAEEEKNTPSFAESLSRLGDIYVDDAFGTAHRAHASVTGVARHLPAVAGFLMEKEIDNLASLLENPTRPYAAVMGGAKISDKLSMVQNIIGKVDCILIGGGMAANFLKARGLEVGKSLIDEGVGSTVSQLLSNIERRKVKLILPVDVVIADKAAPDARSEVVSVERIPGDMMIVDIGTRTIANFSSELEKCRTIFWNGPMGIYETPQFARGTRAIAEKVASLKATTIVGGGSTAEVITEFGLADKITLVSTGGGASLSFLGGEKLPGVEALQDKK